MKTILALLLTLLATVAHFAQAPRSLAFVHANLIAMTGARVQTDMTVIVVGERIAAVGKTGRTKVPHGAAVIDARGKYLIPGLWDMHVHLGDDDFDRDHNLSLFVANGVTGVRMMDGDPAYYRWRSEAENGMMLAPRMFIASAVIGSGDLSDITEERTRAEVLKAKRSGADFVKVHDNLSRASYYALIDEARLVRLPVEGHVPLSMTAAEVSNAGQKSIEHFTGLDEAKSDAAKADALIAVLKKNGTWLCPTLIMRHDYALLNDPRLPGDSRLKYAKPSWRERWLRMTQQSQSWTPTEAAQRKETIRKEDSLLKKMADAGVPILAGTDSANPYVMPGFSLHDELGLMVDAGLTPFEALRTATSNPARFMGQLNSVGTIERGRLADLVLLDADPLDDISNTKKINAVVIRGRLLDRNTLDRLLAEAAAGARSKYNSNSPNTGGKSHLGTSYSFSRWYSTNLNVSSPKKFSLDLPHLIK